MVKAFAVGLSMVMGCASAPAPAVSQVDPLPRPPPSAPSSTPVATEEPVTPLAKTPPAEEAPAQMTLAEEGPMAPLGSCGLVATIAKKADGNGYKLTLENRGKQTLSLVVPGDGSEAAWRTPALSWTGTSGGKPAKAHDASRCGMMNRIEKSEIFSLAPGGKKTLESWIHGPPFDPGTYQVQLKYRNDPKLPTRSASAQGEVATLLAHSSACEVTSAPLTVKIP